MEIITTSKNNKYLYEEETGFLSLLRGDLFFRPHLIVNRIYIPEMFVLLALSLCITLFATSCSEDETSEVSFTSLNMLDENHGKTQLGETGVYINGSMNFRSDSWQVVDLGISSSFPSKTMPNYITIVR